MNRKRAPLFVGTLLLVLLGLGFVLMETFTPKSGPTAPGIALSAEEEPVAAAEEDPWALAWTNQRQYLQDISDATNALRNDLPNLTRNVTRAVMPFEHEARRLFMLSSTYSNNPRVLEAVERRIADTGSSLESAMAPAVAAYANAGDLLEKVTQLEKTIPPELRNNTSSISKDMRSYIDTLTQVQKRLADIMARLDNSLTQGRGLQERIAKAQKDIDQFLPSLWQQQYLMPPVRYVDSANWDDMTVKLTSMAQNFSLRMVLELPQTQQGWITAGMRFCTILLFGGLLAFFMCRKLRQRESGEAFLHIFKTSVPWLLGGMALLAASVTSGSNNVYRALLSLGNVLLIVGQVSLAWDLRRINQEDAPRQSPFWPLCMPTLVGYVLMYPDLPINLLAVSWAAVLVGSILWHRFRTPRPLPLQLETTFLQMDPVFLWLALFMVVFGLPRYSILLYLLFVTVTIALQLGAGSMHLVHAASKHLPQEGAKAIIGSVLIACAAPVVLILVAMGMALWVITLPGGFYLLRHYAVSGVSVGATHFSMLQVLLIISGFYITRAAVSMGSTFLARLPEHGINIDKTLIPPLKTAFTYSLWALFGAFVLKSLGMELSNLAVVAGGLSVGIGFGMQAIVNNFLSGLILIFSRILQEGDVIEVGGLNGVVRKISVRATTVETYDNAVIYVPNSEFVSNRLINWTRNSRSVRREINVGVAYGTDTTLVMRLLRETADANTDVLKYPAPSVLFTDFGNSTLNFSLRFWVHDYDKGVPTASNIRMELEKVFRAHNVEVAFPQLDVHIRDMPRAAGAVRKPAPAPTPAPARRKEDGTPTQRAVPQPAAGRRLARPRPGKGQRAAEAARRAPAKPPHNDTE